MSVRSVSLFIAVVLASACSVQRWQPSKAAAMDEHMTHMTAVDMAAGTGVARASGAAAQGTPGLPASAATAAARVSASPRHAEWVKIAWEPGSSDSLMAWIVYPMTKTKAPVVVVVHEIFGLSTWVRSVADQFAAEGFIAIAPDLNSRVRGGPSTTELSSDSARKLIAGVNFSDRNKGISAVAAYAMSQPSAEARYGVVGYCWGGSTAFGSAVYNGKGLRAAVAFYGLPFTRSITDSTGKAVGVEVIADSLAKITVPMMLLNGSADQRIAAAMPELEAKMKALKKDYVGKNYEGAVHGFLRAQDDGSAPGQQANAATQAAQAANLAATKDAWPLTVSFFKKHLSSK